ncbi:MAG: ScpA family protein [Candidatus Woesearchaeota archaeon]
MEDHIFDLIVNKDEITWQSLLYQLVQQENMNPWDIDVSLLAQKFLDSLRQIRQMDFRVSGKILLAAAILLKIKSERLLGEDLDNLDRLFSQSEEENEDLFTNLAAAIEQGTVSLEEVRLIPRTPQPRKRKVSIFDLVNALQKAMEVKKRKTLREVPDININIPYKKVDMTELIKDVFSRVRVYYIKNKNQKLTFSLLCPSEKKEDKVYTFIPLLHLSNQDQRKIDLFQETQFGEIQIMIAKKESAAQSQTV